MKQYQTTAYWHKYAKYNYKSYKNEEALPFVIIGTVICIIFAKAMIMGLPLLWFWYAWYCAKNNSDLDKNEYIQKQRKAYEKMVWEQYGETVDH